MAKASNISVEELIESVRARGIQDESFRIAIAGQVLERKLRRLLAEGVGGDSVMIEKQTDLALEELTRQVIARGCPVEGPSRSR